MGNERMSSELSLTMKHRPHGTPLPSVLLLSTLLPFLNQ